MPRTVFSMVPGEVDPRAVRGKVFFFERVHWRNTEEARRRKHLTEVVKRAGATVRHGWNDMETAQPNTHFRWTYFTQMELGIHLFICDVQIAVFKTLRLNVPPCLSLSDREMREVLAKNTPITAQLHRAARKFTLAGREPSAPTQSGGGGDSTPKEGQAGSAEDSFQAVMLYRST
ncbi:hypothetical protein EHS25_001025 [Saitozyma podzolica]|uniref:Uncharacterized protein n=1 Tax=Saitozyma podzolica TaxID=1890683 RepID=A0A427YH73_9TREE|nr:hypothetical protein EHS25_001025 [Saitozyma podzolica]